GLYKRQLPFAMPTLDALLIVYGIAALGQSVPKLFRRFLKPVVADRLPTWHIFQERIVLNCCFCRRRLTIMWGRTIRFVSSRLSWMASILLPPASSGWLRRKQGVRVSIRPTC